MSTNYGISKFLPNPIDYSYVSLINANLTSILLLMLLVFVVSFVSLLTVANKIHLGEHPTTSEAFSAASFNAV